MVRGIIIDPQTPRTLYVWGWGCGVFESTDGGNTWTNVDTGLPSDNWVVALAIDPVEPTILYAGTGIVLRHP